MPLECTLHSHPEGSGLTAAFRQGPLPPELWLGVDRTVALQPVVAVRVDGRRPARLLGLGARTAQRQQHLRLSRHEHGECGGTAPTGIRQYSVGLGMASVSTQLGWVSLDMSTVSVAARRPLASVSTQLGWV